MAAEILAEIEAYSRISSRKKIHKKTAKSNDLAVCIIPL